MPIEQDLAEMMAERDRLRRLVIMMAPSFQGGHSRTGGEVADALNIPFPVTMPSLEKRAVAEGLDPNELWPWLAPMRAGKTS